MEEVHHHHHHHSYQQQESVNGRLNKNLLSSSIASMASLAAGTTQTVSSTNPTQPSHLCAGCGHPIKDRYLLQALESYWHEDCLKCSCCGCRLGEVGSNLFTKANLILCKRDYLRLFGATGSCAACCKPIPAFEMVMKAKTNVYHLDCFACQQCHQRFCVGDRFYLCDNQILCEYDYEERLIFANLATSSGCHPPQFNHRPPPPPPPQPPTSQGSQIQSSGPQTSNPLSSENSNSPYGGRQGEGSARNQRNQASGPDDNAGSRPSPPPVAAPPAVKQQQDSPGAIEHDASSSGYGSPDSGGLIDEG